MRATRFLTVVLLGALAPVGVARANPQPRPPVASHPASPSNYTRASTRTIDTIVIHKAEGSATSTWSWFQNPRAQASAHFVVDSNGQMTEMVAEHDIAWHAGNDSVNQRSIGIENAGYSARNDISDAHYRALAKLCRYLCDRYRIPKDRKHVIGHDEVPDPDGHGTGGASNHTDPGPHFDWPRLVRYLNAPDEDPNAYLPGVPRPSAPIGGGAAAPAPAPPSDGGAGNGAQGQRGGMAGGVDEVKDEIEGKKHDDEDRRPEDTAGKDQKVRAIDFGDTLWDIAREHGMTVEQLLATKGADGVTNRDRLAQSSPMVSRGRKFDPNLIFPGQKVVVPSQGERTPAEEPRAPSAVTEAPVRAASEFDEDEAPRRRAK